MLTEKLYYNDSYIKTFEAEVLSCIKKENSYMVILNKTAFYPEGGGQPADTGTLDEIKVTHVQEQNGQIFHIIDRPLCVGQIVTGNIDWDYRFSLMQHHTGEHIVSGIVKQYLGYDNVGFSMGSEFVTMDFNNKLTQQNIEYIEMLANEAIYKNISVKVDYPNSKQLPLLNYRKKKELTKDVRLIVIPDIDICACCGTHTSKTGEIGLIKVVWFQKYKGGTRVYMLCGKKALLDYSSKNKSTYSISAMLSAKTENISSAVEYILNENGLLKQKNAALKKQILINKVAAIEPENKNICIFDDELSVNELRQFCMLLTEKTEQAFVFSGSDEKGYKYAFGSRISDVSLISKDINSVLNGQGGGTKQLAQGFIRSSRFKIEEFFKNLILLNEPSGGYL